MRNKEERELALNLALQDGVRAMQVLSNPVFQAAWDKLKGDLHDEFSMASPGDIEELKRIKAEFDAISRFEGFFAKRVNNGKVAEKKLKSITEEK